MRRLLLAVLLLGASIKAPADARAQIDVRVTTERASFLLFESIPAKVTIRNFSGRPVELANQGDTHWLSFLVTDEAGASLSSVGNAFIAEPVRIDPGRTQSISVDLLTHFDLRQRGLFTVRAVVQADGVQAMSPPTKFTILNGREIWRETIGLPLAEGQSNQQYRTYSLLARLSSYDNVLYAGVQDEAHALVYGMIPLGNYIALGNPTVKVDGVGHLHVLYRSGPRSVSYDEIDPDAKIVKRVVYSDLMSVPQLEMQDGGMVTVEGGEQVYPKLERVMTDADFRPPSPVIPKAKKHKHWWWPFGPKTTQPAPTNSVATASTTNAPSANFGPGS
jgi:hypothetical protein